MQYSDGLRLQIRSVDFATERKEQTGPGAFPGREYAVLSLVVDNRTDKSLSMNTVVITVLDAKGNAVDPVYVPEAKVSDFAGELRPGRTAAARYAFAVPASSRSQVTVVVDFDGAHTSAVFRGKLA